MSCCKRLAQLRGIECGAACFAGQFTKSVIQDRKVENEIRVLMIGLAGGGKTTVLYEMKLGELVTTIPTIGFNVETGLQCRYLRVLP